MEIPLQTQVENAHRRYPSLRVEGQNIRIQFEENPNYEFLISVPATYPHTAPKTHLRSVNDANFTEFYTPITTVWEPVFQIINIMDNIHDYACLVSHHERPNINKQELSDAISRMNPIDCANQISRLNVINQCSFMKSARQQLEREKRGTADIDKDLRAAKEEFKKEKSELKKALDHRNMLLQQYNQIAANQPNMQVIAKQHKIKTLEGTSVSAENYAMQLQQDFNSGKINITQFTNGYAKAKADAARFRLLAKELRELP